MKKKPIVWTILILLSSTYSWAFAQSGLSPSLKHIVTNNRAEHAFWTLSVRDSSGKTIQAFHAKKLIRPASNLKLLTSATVLKELGPHFTYRTSVYGTGHQEGKTWNGNVVIRGAGDPSLSGTFYDEDRLHVMQEFYNLFDSRGIDRIKGNLIGNDAYFDTKAYPDGWSWDDLSFYYAVPVNALSYNNNTVDLTVYANGMVGDKPTIEWFPFDTDYVTFINEQRITPANAHYDEGYQRLLGTNTILLRSHLPKGYVEKESLSIDNPPFYFIDTFKKYLQDGNISVNGHLIVDDNDYNWEGSAFKRLGMHVSPPLSKLLKQLNKQSDNFYAEMLLKTAAAEHYQIAGSTDLGISLMKQFAESVGINTEELSISDGSGMSATDLISTGDLSKLLAAMLNSRYFKTFKNSLPIAGVDGSLEHRFTHSPLKKNLFAKTGYVAGVRTLSGYLQTKSHKTLVFSIATNNYTVRTSYIDLVQEKILAKLYNLY